MTKIDGRKISGPEHVIPKIVGLLRPGGIFIMSVPVDDPNFISWVFNKIDTDRSHVSKLPKFTYIVIWFPLRPFGTLNR